MDWIKTDDGGQVAIVPCTIHPEHAQAVMQGSLVFAIDNEGRDVPDMRQASICLTIDNLRALAEQALQVADRLDLEVPDAKPRAHDHRMGVECWCGHITPRRAMLP